MLKLSNISLKAKVSEKVQKLKTHQTCEILCSHACKYLQTASQHLPVMQQQVPLSLPPQKCPGMHHQLLLSPLCQHSSAIQHQAPTKRPSVLTDKVRAEYVLTNFFDIIFFVLHLIYIAFIYFVFLWYFILFLFCVCFILRMKNKNVNQCCFCVSVWTWLLCSGSCLRSKEHHLKSWHQIGQGWLCSGWWFQVLQNWTIHTLFIVPFTFFRTPVHWQQNSTTAHHHAL